METRDRIQKLIDDLPEEVLPSVLGYLQEVKRAISGDHYIPIYLNKIVRKMTIS